MEKTELIKTKDTDLIKFIRNECANYFKHYEMCTAGEDSCVVMDGFRCWYFEKSVIGPQGYKYPLPGYDYSKLWAEYGLTKVHNQESQEPEGEGASCRSCSELRLPGHSYCSACAEQRKKEANRIRKQRQRKAVEDD